MTARLDMRKVAADVRDRISGCPESHDQSGWITSGSSGIPFGSSGEYLQASAQEWADCGTTACVAGHMAAVVARDHPEMIIWPDDKTGGQMGTRRQSDEAVVDTMRGLGMNPDELWAFDVCRTRAEVFEWLDAVAAGEDPTDASERLALEQV